MYQYLDKLLARVKKKLKAEFNRLGVMGFDQLNVVNTGKYTKEMFDRFLADNEAVYLKVAKDAHRRGIKAAKAAGFSGKESEIDGSWLEAILVGYILVTGYLYKKEAERKRLRLNEQILTAREYADQRMLRESLRKSANLWWTQTMQYGITVVDEATLQAYKDMGVKRVRWKAEIDGRECKTCRGRHNKIYEISKVPTKTHYGCRCYLEPVKTEE